LGTFLSGPINTTAPYAQIHDRFTGKTRMPVKDKGCTVQKRAA